MRAVVQRVSKASVGIAGKETAAIGQGILILLGIENADTVEDIKWLSARITRLRIFNDEKGVMNLSVRDTGGDILVVSQFTLHASVRKGNRPSYIKSAASETAIPLYEQFVRQLKKDLGKSVATGKFGAMMTVALENDGPVTIVIDTKNKE